MLAANGASKYYGDVMALEQLTLSFAPGQVVGLFGENGAGKTTLLKALAGILKPTHGWVSMGEVPLGTQHKGMIAYASHEGTLPSYMTVKEASDFLEAIWAGFDRTRFDAIMDYFAISQKRRIAALSRGQLMQVEVAAGLCKRAPYLLMDEHYLGMDPAAQADMLKLTGGMLGEEQCLVLATHQPQAMENLFSRAVLLSHGRLKADVNMDDLAEEGRSLGDLLQATYGRSPEGILTLLDK